MQLINRLLRHHVQSAGYILFPLYDLDLYVDRFIYEVIIALLSFKWLSPKCDFNDI